MLIPLFSLFRLPSMDEAMSMFSVLYNVLPPLYNSSRAFMTKEILQVTILLTNISMSFEMNYGKRIQFFD